MKVVIDPVDDILYMSFYIYGLEQMFGRANVQFSDKPFSALSQESRHTRSMRFVIDDGQRCKKYMISCNDSYKVIPELYDWCDVYGSVNANYDCTSEEYHPKLISLCPSFAIRCWSPSHTGWRAIMSLPSCGSNVKKHLGKHRRLLNRNQYEEYGKPSVPLENYVFSCSTLWYSDEWNKNDERVNLSRAHFIRACKSIEGLVFEGGLVSSGKNQSSQDLFFDCFSRPYSMKQWTDNTRLSVFVFNTPAFWNCHGWKLGEYMSMGKAILSTPISNDLPMPLLHEGHIHIVDNSQESMAEAIRYLLSHSSYREKLERNIKSYWLEYGTPIASLKRLGI